MPLVVDVNDITIWSYLSMAGIMTLVCAASLFTVLTLATQARKVFRSPVALQRINRGSAGMMAGAAVVIGLKN